MLIFFRRTLLFLLALFLCSAVLSYSRENFSIGIISQNELISRIKEQHLILILDVRTEKEYQAGHIPTAINIDFRKLKKKIKKIEQYKNSPVVVYCEHGIRAKIAEPILKQAGFQAVFHLQGDMLAWRKNSLPIDFN